MMDFAENKEIAEGSHCLLCTQQKLSFAVGLMKNDTSTGGSFHSGRPVSFE